MATTTKVSRKIDIFSAGCVYHYVLSIGSHAFGDRHVRESNILKGNYKLDDIDLCGEEAVEVKDLVRRMIARVPKMRPDAGIFKLSSSKLLLNAIDEVLVHPYFWSAHERLQFLGDVSDRFEAEVKDPPSALLKQLERILSYIH